MFWKEYRSSDDIYQISKLRKMHTCSIAQRQIIIKTKGLQNYHMKNLRCLSEFLAFLATSQAQLEANQLQLHKVCPNPNELFRGLCRSNTVQLGKADLEFFVKSFGYDLYRPEIEGSNYRLLRKPSNKQKLLSEAISVLMREYGNGESLTYEDFCWLAFGDNQAPLSATARNNFSTREALFSLLQCQLQNLIDIQNFKRIVSEETPKLDEAFRAITTNKMTVQAMKRLLNVNGIFLGEQVSKIVVRLKGQLTEKEFVKYFQTTPNNKETKIFQSSIKKRDLKESSVSFGTPVKKTFLTQASTGRKHLSALSQIKTKQFRDEQPTPNRFQILQEICSAQLQFQRRKQSLILDPSTDLQLVYDTLLQQFTPLLKVLYKDNSFTSFLRFLFPSTWEHQYLGFIRYNIDNRIPEGTLEKIRQLKRDYEDKEHRVEDMWARGEGTGINREQIFREISSDATTLSKDDLNKWLSDRSVKLLMLRMDRMASGKISLGCFR